MSVVESFPPFCPPIWLRSGHAQTLAALAFVGPRVGKQVVRHRLDVGSGDVVVLTEDCPENWQDGDRAALLVHGLAGCHQSPYMRRIAAKLVAVGVRVFRLDLRGCGAGEGLSRLPYHAGLTADVRAAVDAIGRLCAGSPISVVGFSLGGNLVLKLLGEAALVPLVGVDRAIAVCPPVDLEHCCRSLDRGLQRLYDRHFVSLLVKKARGDARQRGGNGSTMLARRPRSLFAFDDVYTAPVSGFENAAHYYRESSAAGFIAKIETPTIVLASHDDPVVPFRVFDSIAWPETVRLIATTHGGHLGYIGRRGMDADRCWMDWRVVEWVAEGSARRL